MLKKVLKNLQHKIFTSWDECENHITGIRSPRQKGFKTLEDSQDYLNGVNSHKGINSNEIVDQLAKTTCGLQ